MRKRAVRDRDNLFLGSHFWHYGLKRKVSFTVGSERLYRLHRERLHSEAGIRVELRLVLIIISASVCGVAISTFHTTNSWVLHYIELFCLAMVDFYFLNFSSLFHTAACVQINWFVVGCTVFSALLDINMQLLGGFAEKQEVNIPLG